MRSALFFTLFFATRLFAQTTEWPVAQKVPHQTIIHGDTLTDNYFWLRDKYSPEVVNFLYGNNAYAESVMKSSLNLQKKLYDEFRSRMKENHTSKPVRNKNYFYYSVTTQDQEYAITYRKRDSLTAKPQVVLDMNTIAKEYLYFNLPIYALSHDQSLLAYGVDSKGHHVSELFIRHIDGDSLLKNEKLPAMLSLIWANDNKTFFYTVPEPKTLRAWRVYKHILGTDSTRDELILEEPDKTFQLRLSSSSSDTFIFISSGKTKSNEIYYLNANHPNDKPRLFYKRQPDLIYDIDHYEGDEFYIETNLNAPNGQLMKSPIAATSPGQWSKVIPHREKVLFGRFVLLKNYLVWSETENATMRVLVQNRLTGTVDTIKPKHDFGTISFSFENYHYDTTRELIFSVGNMVVPGENYSYNLISREQKFISADTLNVPYDASKYETKRLWAKSEDGVMIPMTIAYKKGIILNGQNPVLMQGYGSYGSSSFPGFSSGYISYLDRGFIIVQTHIRGGMELGHDWYEKGKMLYKKNTFYDFIACAELLIKEKYTNPSRLAVSGGSAGGLLMGAVVNMRPDLFKCVVADVPFVDVINTMLDESIPLTTFEFEEWGNPKIKKYYEYMKSYSPYDNVKAQAYPDMLVTAGYNDAQVGYWEPAKWVSKLRDLKTDTNLLLFKTGMEGGHSGSSGRYAGLKEAAFEMAFIMRSLGLKENYITLKGKVVDEYNEPMPYATVYLDDHKTGTTTNGDGIFELKVNEFEKNSLIVQSVGYVKQNIKLDINTRTENIIVKMKSEDFQLKTVVHRADAKDPALGIIKEAIKHRKDNFDRVQSFSADVYMKSNVRLLEIPKKIPKFLTIGEGEKIDSSKLGMVYLSESVAKYYFEKPDHIKEQMIASKVAGSKQGFSFNRVADVFINFYNPTIDLIYYSDRPFISPIAPLATLSYKYTFEGSFFAEGKEVNKIKVIPLRKGDPLFHGYIYITEKDYQIYATDLFITKDANISFVDTVHIQQEMMNMDGNWVPVQMKVFSFVKVFGFKATDMSVAGMSNYSLNKKYPKGFFNYEVFSIEKNANKKDTQYWTTTRTIVLSEEEDKHYKKSDSIYQAHHTPAYLDSIERKANKFKPFNMLTSGYYRYKRTDTLFKSFRMGPLPLSVGYNTVEGPYINYYINFYKYNNITYETRSFTPVIRYGFTNQNPAGGFYYYKTLNVAKKSSYSVKAGRFIEQYNPADPINTFINTTYTLFDGRNFMKILQKDILRLSYRQELVNGLYTSASTQYQVRRAMVNHTGFTFDDKKQMHLTSNNPLSPVTDALAFVKHQGLEYELALRYVHKQYYETINGYKSVNDSRYPDIYVSFQHGIGLDHIKYNFQYLEIGSGKDIDLRVLGTLSFDVNAGKFFNTSNMTFADFRHFNGNQTMFLDNPQNLNSAGTHTRSRLTSFHALNYYLFSTNSNFFEVHAKQDFRGFIIGKVPLLRKLRASEIAGFNLLVTPTLTYNEVYIGLDNIFHVLRIDAGKATSTSNNNLFLRFSLGF